MAADPTYDPQSISIYVELGKRLKNQPPYNFLSLTYSYIWTRPEPPTGFSPIHIVCSSRPRCVMALTHDAV